MHSRYTSTRSVGRAVQQQDEPTAVNKMYPFGLSTVDWHVMTISLTNHISKSILEVKVNQVKKAIDSA